jgi:hypothetical protein
MIRIKYDIDLSKFIKKATKNRNIFLDLINQSQIQYSKLFLYSKNCKS